MRFLAASRRIAVAAASAALLATPALGQGSFFVSAPGPATSQIITFNISNRDHFAINAITFGLGGTHSLRNGTPLTYDATSGLFNVNNGTTGTFGVTSPANNLSFTVSFTSFLTGQTFGFDWDPDCCGDPGYGAQVSELSGTTVSIATPGGTVSGAFTGNGANGFSLEILSPTVPEPATLVLVAPLGLAIVAARRRLARR